MRVLAFDPGTGQAGSAWGVVHAVGGRVSYVAHGSVPYQADAMRLRQLARAQQPDVVAVEGVAPYLKDRKRLKGVLAVAVEAGRLLGAYQAAGYRTASLPATSPSGANWRGHLTRDRSAGDAQVKAALELLLAGLPTRTNNHHRDALGLALVIASHARAGLL